jgi:hypothetical protein
MRSSIIFKLKLKREMVFMINIFILGLSRGARGNQGSPRRVRSRNRGNSNKPRRGSQVSGSQGSVSSGSGSGSQNDPLILGKYFRYFKIIIHF